MIEKLKYLFENSEDFINEYFDKILNEIDLRRETNKLVIEKWYDDSLKEIQAFKDDCISKSNNESGFQMEIRSLLKTYEFEFEVLQKKLIIPELSEEEFSFEKIDQNASFKASSLSEQIDKLKVDLIQRCEFKLGVQKEIMPQDFGKIQIYKKVG